MKFFIDAQLPHQVKFAFIDIGHEAIHANELPDGMRTSDSDIILILSAEVVIVSKDDDFYQSALLHGRPLKLVYLTLGNASRQATVALFRRSARQIVELLGQYDILELTEGGIIGLK